VTTAALADTVRAERRGDIGVITLDRVTALNALNTEMVDTLDMVLAEWENAGLRAVVLDSASPKAFCAGGDIRAVRQNSLAGDPEASERFFATEYRLNARIADYPVPFISLIDGICMGGGMGLSIHGTFRSTRPPNIDISAILNGATTPEQERAVAFARDVRCGLADGELRTGE